MAPKVFFESEERTDPTYTNIAHFSIAYQKNEVVKSSRTMFLRIKEPVEHNSWVFIVVPTKNIISTVFESQGIRHQRDEIPSFLEEN